MNTSTSSRSMVLSQQQSYTHSHSIRFGSCLPSSSTAMSMSSSTSTDDNEHNEDETGSGKMRMLEQKNHQLTASVLIGPSRMMIDSSSSNSRTNSSIGPNTAAALVTHHNQHEHVYEPVQELEQEQHVHRQQRPRGRSMSLLVEEDQRQRQRQLQRQHRQGPNNSFRKHMQISNNQFTNDGSVATNTSVVELAASALTSLRGSSSVSSSVDTFDPNTRQNVNDNNTRWAPQRRRSMSVNDASATSSSSLSSTGVGTVIRQAKKAASSLCILLHAQNCTTGTCPVAGCREAKALQIHLKACDARNDSTQSCPSRYHGCDQSRKLLAHYRQCKSTRIGRRSAVPSSSTSSSMANAPTQSTGQTSLPALSSSSSTSPQCLVCSLVARMAKSLLDNSISSSSQCHSVVMTPSTSTGTTPSSLLSSSIGKKISPKSAPTGRVATSKFTLTSNGSASSSSKHVSLHIPIVTSSLLKTNLPGIDSMDTTALGAINSSMPPPPPRLPKLGPMPMPMTPVSTPSPVPSSATTSPLNVLSYTAAQRCPAVFPTCSGQDIAVNDNDDMMIDDEEDSHDEPKLLSPRRPRSHSHSSFLTTTSLNNDSNNFNSNQDTPLNVLEEVEQQYHQQHDNQDGNDVTEAMSYVSTTDQLRRTRSVSVGSGGDIHVGVGSSSYGRQQLKKGATKWIAATSSSCETILEHQNEDDQQSKTRADSTTSSVSSSSSTSSVHMSNDGTDSITIQKPCSVDFHQSTTEAESANTSSLSSSTSRPELVTVTAIGPTTAVTQLF